MTGGTGAREILFLAHRIPYPPDRGDKIRSFNIVKRLAELGPVHVATFDDDKVAAERNVAGLVTALGANLSTLFVAPRSAARILSLISGALQGRSASMASFSSHALRNHVSSVLGRGSIASIFAFSGQMSQYVPEKIGKTRFVMDFVDVDSAKFESYADAAAPPLSWLYRREAAQLAREERGTAERADVSLFVTEAESALFRSRSGLDDHDVRPLENGVDLGFFYPDASFVALKRDAPLLVFSGQMDYAPNVAAVTQFAQETLPKVREVARDATFAIVGRHPTPAVQALSRLDGVEVVGAVDDMRPWLAAADVVVAPLRIARGIQNKVLEAMAMARPVVASPAAFEGIDAEPGRDLLVADGDEAVSAILSLLRDGELAARIGRSARSQMCARYAWDRQLAALPELVFG